jgi:hypothetical protein
VDSGFGQLLSEAAAFKRSAFAESTKIAYRCHRDCLIRFCIYFSRVPIPADQITLKGYVAFLARSIKSSSINGYLNIVRILHLEAGFANPLQDNFEIQMVKRGIARQLGTPPVQMLPLNLSILRSLFPLFDFSKTADVAFWGALLLGFFGMLRKSTLLLKNSRCAPVSGLCRSDILNVTSDSFVLSVRHSKTIQFGQRTLQVPFLVCDDTRICPVRFMLMHLTMSVLPGDSPLFAYVESGSMFVLAQNEFVTRLRASVAAVGLDPLLYSGHSMRRGGCTFGYSAGLSVVDLKLRGDWRSDAVEKYLHVPTSQIFNSARVMSAFAARD